LHHNEQYIKTLMGKGDIELHLTEHRINVKESSGEKLHLLKQK